MEERQLEQGNALFITYLEERKAYLSNLLEKAKKQDEKLITSALHKIRVQKHGNGYQYYLRTSNEDSVGKYLKRDQDKMIKQVMQKEYLEKSIRILEDELSTLNLYLSKTPPNLLRDSYGKMNSGRRIMVEPFEIDDKEYVDRWLAVSYEGKEFVNNSTGYYTQKMERVRSKSEIIIANSLQKYGIPYRYEYPIKVNGMGKVYPDFTVLNVKRRKEMYWEHFGLVDDFDYREKSMHKLSIYEKNDIYIGDNLIVTWESAEQPLNVKAIERKIEKYLL